jgi:hypothetical protein
LTDLDFGTTDLTTPITRLLYTLTHGEDTATRTEDKGGDASMIIRPKLPGGYGHNANFSALTSDNLHNIIQGN